MTVTILPGTGTPVLTGLSFPAITPPPVSAAGDTVTEPLLLSLLPVRVAPSTEPPCMDVVQQDSTERPTAENDPQLLMAMLLAAPVSLPPAGTLSPAPVPRGEEATVVAQNRAPTEAAGLLRTHLLATGGAPGGAPGPLQPQCSEEGQPPPARLPLAGGPDVLAKPVPPGAGRPDPTARPERQNLHLPQAAEGSVFHPAPALAQALMKSEAAAGKLPAIVLPDAPAQQAEALQKALAGRLTLQIERHEQKATIRLDPPHLGKVDISIHFESGKLQVQIQAATPEVTRLLQQVSNEMRASLSEQNNVQVNVQVSTQSGDSRQQPRHRPQPETAIANNNEEVTAQQRGTDGTILTMV